MQTQIRKVNNIQLLNRQAIGHPSQTFMKNHYLGSEIEAAESRLIESKQIYQNLLRQTDRNIYSFIRENSKLRQEIKSLKQTIKKLTKEKEKYEKLTCSVNVA